MMVRVVYYPLFSEENAVIGGAVTVEDITEKHLTQQALKASEEKYRLIFDSSPLGILHYDANGVITECNPKTLELSGATYDDLIGFDLINGVKEEAFLNAIRNSLAGTPGELEGKYLSVTGNKQSYLRAFTVPIHDAEKNIIGGICVAEDISEKILFEKALQQSEKRYRLLFDSAPLAFTLSDFEGSLMDFNQSALALFGYSDYETRNIKTSIGYSDPSIRRELLEALHRDGFVTGRELKFKKKNGELMDTLVNLTVIEIENKKYILSILADITKQKQIEKELKESHEKMRNLTKYLQSARENERTSIARELHDELGQVLTAINMEAAWVAQKISKEQEILKPRMEVISELAVGAIGSVKRIITELRPTLLSDLGLPAAIRWQAEDYQQRIGIKFEVAIEPEEFVLDEDLGIAIFRIFQEATTNAVRHSHATHVSISLSEDPSEIVLVVKDNGIGITEDKLELNESFGIMGMRERAEVFGGSLEISGMPGKGTTLEAKFPIWR
jgi:two-component system sensor histidine kinase UhpB